MGLTRKGASIHSSDHLACWHDCCFCTGSDAQPVAVPSIPYDSPTTEDQLVEQLKEIVASYTEMVCIFIRSVWLSSLPIISERPHLFRLF